MRFAPIVIKPHLYMRRGVWCCRPGRLLMFANMPLGHGNNPKEAYDDWLDQL